MAEPIKQLTREQQHEIDFRAVWSVLSRRSQCDGIDGMEYQRVYASWVAGGRPRPICHYIQWAANRPPERESDE